MPDDRVSGDAPDAEAEAVEDAEAEEWNGIAAEDNASGDGDVVASDNGDEEEAEEELKWDDLYGAVGKTTGMFTHRVFLPNPSQLITILSPSSIAIITTKVRTESRC